MNVEISRLLAEEHVERLRDAAQAPPGRLAVLVRRLFRSEERPAVPAWVARSSDTRELHRAA